MKKIKTLYFMGVLMMYITSMHPWFVWDNEMILYSCIFTFVLSVFCMFFKKGLFQPISLKALILFFSLFFVMMYDASLKNINGKLEYVFLFFVILSLFKLKDNFREELLSFLTKIFAIFLSVSLLFYVLFLIGLLPISPEIIQSSGERYVSLNYYLFIIKIDDSIAEYIRFKSVFMEPGHLTMGLVPLLFANKFNLKNKYVLMLFISAVFTFSLAAYVVMFICYFLLNFSLSKLRVLCISLLTLTGVILLAYVLGYGEMLDTFIWNRLEFTGSTISGDNRVTSEFESVYRSVLNSSDVWFGNSSVDVNAFGGISGYKKYLVEHGLIGCMFILFIYSLGYLLYKKYIIAVFSLVFILLLFQNAYPFWYCLLIVYVIGLNEYRKSGNENIVYSS